MRGAYATLAVLAALCLWALGQESAAESTTGCGGMVAATAGCHQSAQDAAGGARLTLWQQSVERRAERRSDRVERRHERQAARRTCGG